MSIKPNTKYKNIQFTDTFRTLLPARRKIGPHYLENNDQIRLRRLLILGIFGTMLFGPNNINKGMVLNEKNG